MAPHPEFDATLVPSIGDAILARLRDDGPVSGYFAAGIDDAELDAIWLANSYSTPALLVALEALDDAPQASGWSELTTVWQLTLVTTIEQGPGTDGWLRARIISRIQMLLAAQNGTLRDEAGDRITESIARFQRIGRPIPTPDNTVLRTPMRVAYLSHIDTQTREFEP